MRIFQKHYFFLGNMTLNAFSIQGTMLDITQTAMDSGDKEHVQYGIIMKNIFSRKHSCEQVNADDIPILPIRIRWRS
jgi:hypothetical protein